MVGSQTDLLMVKASKETCISLAGGASQNPWSYWPQRKLICLMAIDCTGI